MKCFSCLSSSCKPLTFLWQNQEVATVVVVQTLHNRVVNFCIFHFFKSIVSMIVPCTLEQRQARRAPPMPYDQSIYY